MKAEKKGKRIKSSLNGEIPFPLPEEVIQHIQSFMSGKEAARTTILSKSWNNAWLTRPRLDLETRDFNDELFPKSQPTFEEFVKKTTERYLNLNMKIDSFRLHNNSGYNWDQKWITFCHNLIVNAMKMGATTVQLELWSFDLPQEVLRSETLLKLSLIGCKVSGSYNIRCSRLKSLTLENVDIKNKGVFKDMITCCISMEELSLSRCAGLELSLINMYELHKLRRLLLDNVVVDSMFFTDFASRFPCLKYLRIDKCQGCTNVQIASTSLETICLKADKASKAAKFDVPNIRKLAYSCFGLPSHLSIDGPSREWEFDISIVVNRFHRTSWFVNLKRLLKKFRLSRISLCINLNFTSWRPSIDSKHEVDVEFVPSPLVVESLMIEAPSTYYSPLVVRSLGVFRPKFITPPYGIHYALMLNVAKSTNTLCRRVFQELFISDWKDKFGQFGLKQVNVEIYEESDPEWRPLGLKRSKATNADSEAEVRFQLIWED